MEACGGAHFWARKLQALGHTVRLMAPQFVKPYVKTNKNDMADAEAICEAVARPNMRFVPIKNVDQQAVLALHRARQGFVRARTAQANQIRGLLGEFSLVIPRGITSIAQHVPQLIEDATNELPGSFRLLVQRLIDHLKELDRQVEELEMQIKAWHHANDASRRLARAPWTISVRKYVSPRLVMPSSNGLPPLECCLGTKPSHAVNCRALLKHLPSPIEATRAQIGRAHV